MIHIPTPQDYPDKEGYDSIVEAYKDTVNVLAKANALIETAKYMIDKNMSTDLNRVAALQILSEKFGEFIEENKLVVKEETV